MTTDQLCDCCRDAGGRHLFNALDESGASAVFACEPCAKWIRVSLETSAAPRCFVCSDATDGDYSVVEAGEHPRDAARSTICAACRKQFVFNHGRPVFVSKQEVKHD
jgi:hypothetical protein